MLVVLCTQAKLSDISMNNPYHKYLIFLSEKSEGIVLHNRAGMEIYKFTCCLILKYINLIQGIWDI